MRYLALCGLVLLAGCGTYTSVIGPYRASLSRADVRSIVQIAPNPWAGHYNTITLNAVAADRVSVETKSQNIWSGYVAIRRGGTWKREPYRSHKRPNQAMQRTAPRSDA
jgi:DMSO/TMAO reductase YedYZ molybdopterin-dependent catalytic subunit